MIDLLFDNPIIIGVVIFFLWTLFKPSKEEKKAQQQRPNGPNTMNAPKAERTYPERNRQQTPSIDRKALTTTSAELETPRKKVTLTQSNANDASTFDYVKEKQKLEDRKKLAEEALAKLQAKPASIHSSTASSGIKRQRLQKPTQAQLREGIIWAEILGKPKARRNIKS